MATKAWKVMESGHILPIDDLERRRHHHQVRRIARGIRFTGAGEILRLLNYSQMLDARGKPMNDPFRGVGSQYKTILADPPWRFSNSTGKVAPEHKRLSRYGTMTFADIEALPVGRIAAPKSHLYLWCPNALLPQGLSVMAAWGFQYKGNIVWHKIRKDGGPDGRGVGFYFRNVTELILFGTRGQLRTGAPGRRQVNFLATRKREHSRKPDEIYPIIEACSFGPFLELFARHSRPGWKSWGNEVDESPVSRSDRAKRLTYERLIAPEVQA